VDHDGEDDGWDEALLMSSVGLSLIVLPTTLGARNDVIASGC